MAKKPVGVNGSVRMTDQSADFQRLEFPENKEDMEAFIAASFARHPAPDGFIITDVKQNQQDDFDFSIKTNRGPMSLELMEIAPLEHLRGSYEKAPSSYKPYEFAAYIRDKALGKSVRYTGSTSSRIVLLLYVTHWSFVLSETVVALLQYWFQEKANSFEGIYVHQPIDATFGVTNLLHPTPSSFWASFDPEKYKDNVVHNLSPLNWTSSNSNG